MGSIYLRSKYFRQGDLALDLSQVITAALERSIRRTDATHTCIRLAASVEVGPMDELVETEEVDYGEDEGIADN